MTEKLHRQFFSSISGLPLPLPLSLFLSHFKLLCIWLDVRSILQFLLTYLTYCRVASQFTVCDASAAFSILAESSLHCFLSFASSVILTRSSVEWSLKWSISPRSLFSTIGRVVVGRPLSLWPYWMK